MLSGRGWLKRLARVAAIMLDTGSLISGLLERGGPFSSAVKRKVRETNAAV
jgi:hypothetical protein